MNTKWNVEAGYNWIYYNNSHYRGEKVTHGNNNDNNNNHVNKNFSAFQGEVL